MGGGEKKIKILLNSDSVGNRKLIEILRISLTHLVFGSHFVWQPCVKAAGKEEAERTVKSLPYKRPSSGYPKGPKVRAY